MGVVLVVVVVACTISEIIATKVQNTAFFHTLLVFLTRIWDHRIFNPGQLWHAGSPDTVLSSHVPISTFSSTV